MTTLKTEEIEDRGYISYRVRKGVMVVDMIYVQPPYRRQGIAKQLIQLALDKAGVHQLRAKKEGFTEDGRKFFASLKNVEVLGL